MKTVWGQVYDSLWAITWELATEAEATSLYDFEYGCCNCCLARGMYEQRPQGHKADCLITRARACVAVLLWGSLP